MVGTVDHASFEHPGSAAIGRTEQFEARIPRTSEIIHLIVKYQIRIETTP
jgi:hypothetical protein